MANIDVAVETNCCLTAKHRANNPVKYESKKSGNHIEQRQLKFNLRIC
jgi:hypothetical protein